IVPTPFSPNSLIAVSQPSIVSPPQKCLKIVLRIIPWIGNPIFSAKLVMDGPTFVKKLFAIILNNQYALSKSLSLLLLKAISVLSKDNVLGSEFSIIIFICNKANVVI